MITRRTLIGLAAAATLALSGCGGDDEASAPESDALSTQVSAEPAADAPADTSATNDAAGGAETSTTGDGSSDGCDEVLTVEEVEAAMGSAPQIDGSGEVCQFTFDSGTTGTFQVLSGPAADEAFTSQMQSGLSDEGELLDDGQGFVLADTVVVKGASGQVFNFSVPIGDELADQASMQSIADLLVTR